MKIKSILTKIRKSEQGTVIKVILLVLIFSIDPIVPHLYQSEGKIIIYPLAFFPAVAIIISCMSIVEQLKVMKFSMVLLDLLSIIFIYAMVYTNMYFINPDSFTIVNGGIPYLDMLYFSIVTFTTLGYGDIVPVSYGAKFISASEAFLFSCIIAFSLITFSDNIKKHLSVYNQK